MNAEDRGDDKVGEAAERALEPGDRAPFFILPDQTGTGAAPLEDHHSGKPAVLIFRQGLAEPLGLDEFSAFQDRLSEFAALDANLFAITADAVEANATIASERGLGFKLLADPELKAARAFGLPPQATADTIVLDPNYRIAAMLGAADRASHVEAALAAVTELHRARPNDTLTVHPPVLVIPRVLGGADCRMLMEVFERETRVYQSDGFTAEGHDTEAEDFKVRTDTHGRLTAHIIKDRDLARYLDSKLIGRINLEIHKAFQTRVRKREDMRVACYAADDSGHLGAHRDNPTRQTRHRRFTFSVTLNAEDFEGGALRFPEYSGQRYLVETGSAVVWSAALLHEVEPITEGRRFILGAHIYGKGGVAPGKRGP